MLELEKVLRIEREDQIVADVELDLERLGADHHAAVLL
jgi:hypothetical protein